MIARLLDVPVEVAGAQDHDDPDGYQDADREDCYFHVGPPLVFYYCRRPRAYHARPLTTAPFCRLTERAPRQATCPRLLGRPAMRSREASRPIPPLWRSRCLPRVRDAALKED